MRLLYEHVKVTASLLEQLKTPTVLLIIIRALVLAA